MLAVEITMTHVWTVLGILAAVVAGCVVFFGAVYLAVGVIITELFKGFWNR